MLPSIIAIIIIGFILYTAVIGMIFYCIGLDRGRNELEKKGIMVKKPKMFDPFSD